MLFIKLEFLDNLISDPMKQIWIYILEDINFLTLGIFLDFFWIFYEFDSIYFELNSLKIFSLSHADMANDVART